MSRIMTLELLSSIKGAKESAAVRELFSTIKNASSLSENKDDQLYGEENLRMLEELRDDEIIQSSEIERKIIRENFPESKEGFLIVSKVIDEI